MSADPARRPTLLAWRRSVSLRLQRKKPPLDPEAVEPRVSVPPCAARARQRHYRERRWAGLRFWLVVLARARRRGVPRRADAGRDRARLRALDPGPRRTGTTTRGPDAATARSGRSSSGRGSERSRPRSPPRGCSRRTSARRRSSGRTSSASCSRRSRSATGSAGAWPTGGPSRSLLGLIVLAAAVFVAAIPFVAKPFLDLTVEGLDETSAGAVIGSFLAVLLLCAPPVVLLGMVSPFAIRLAVSSIATAGAGRRAALRALDRGIAARHVPARARPHPRDRDAADVPRRRGAPRGLVVLPPRGALPRRRGRARGARGIPPGAVKARDGLLHEETSYQQYIQVVEEDDGRRLLYLNEGIAVHSVWRPNSVLTGGVWDSFLALPPLLGRDLERVAILGNAAGTTARALGVYYPNAEIDGVELDPAVSRVGRRYFGIDDNPRLTVHDADARPFLRSTDERYDLIVVDAYHQPYVPFYLATREFFRLVRERLAPGGIVALNVATVPDDRRLVTAIGTTLRAELPQVARVARASLQHARARAHEAARRAPSSRRRLRSGPDDLAPLRELLAQQARPLTPSGRAWTDDRAPVEWVTDRMIVSFAAHGGRLDEDFLPDPAVGRACCRARTTRRTAALHRPSRSGRARAREHARARSARRSRPESTSSSSTSSASAPASSSSRTRRPARGQPRRGGRDGARARPRERCARSLPISRRSTRRSPSSWTRRPRSACTSTSRTGRSRSRRPRRARAASGSSSGRS